MLSSDIFSQNFTFNDKLFKLGYSSKTEIEKFYNTVGPLKCYHEVLGDLAKSVQAKKLENVKPLGQFLVQLNKIEKKDVLKDFMEHKDCPMRQTNLIILSSKYGANDILKHLLDKNNKFVNSLSVDIGKSSIGAFDEDGDGKNAFYYAIRSNDVELLTTLIDKWPGGITNEVVDEVLSKAYRKLHLCNIDLSEDMKIFIENKLLNIRFYRENFSAASRPEVGLDDVQKRGNFVIKIIENLVKNSGGCDKTVDQEFIFNLRSLIANIYALKRELKSTYDRLPWEEIHFCLVVFVKYLNDKQNDGLYYRAIITKDKLLKYLKEFVEHLRVIFGNLQAADLNLHQIAGNLTRQEVIEKLSANSDAFKGLYADYSALRDFSTLNKVLYFIDLVMSSKIASKEYEFLVIERCVQVIDENRPNLSSDLSGILASTFSDDTRKKISNLRRLLLMKFALTRRIQVKETNQSYNEGLKQIKEDLLRLRSFIVDLFYQRKNKVFDKLIADIFDCKSFDEFYKICEIFNWGQIDVLPKNMLPSSLSTNPVDKLKDLISVIDKELSANVKNALYMVSYDQIVELIESIQKGNNKTFIQFDVRLKNLISKVFFEDEMCRKKYQNGTIFDYLDKLKKQLESIAPKNEEDNIQLPLALQVAKSPQYVFELFINMVVKWIQSLESEFTNNHLFSMYLHQMLLLLTENSKNIIELKQLRRKIVPEPNSKKRTIRNTDILLDKIQLLKLILQDSKLLNCNLKTVKNFMQNSNNRQMIAAIEMLLLDILSLNDKKLCENAYFLDDDFPLLTGKELHRHIAHGNFVFDVQPFNIELSVITNSINYVLHYEKKLTVQQQPASIAAIPGVRKIIERFFNEQKIIEMNLKLFKMTEELPLVDIKSTIDFSLVDYYARDLENYSLVEIAAKNHDRGVLMYFMKECPKFDLSLRKNCSKQNVIHLAASTGNHHAIDFIVRNSKSKSKSSNLITECDYLKRTSLHYAVISGSYKTVECILNVNSDCTLLSDGLKMRPVDISIQSNNIKIFELLLKYDPLIDDKRYANGSRYLISSSELGLLDFVRFLIKLGVDVNGSSDEGYTALHVACFKGQYDVVEFLLQNGAKMTSIRKHTATPLHCAITTSQCDLIRLLIKHGADVNALMEKTNYKVLISACWRNRTEMVKVLLENGADPCCKTPEGLTPLHVAVLKANEEIVRYLLKYKKVDVNSVDKHSQTPLHFAGELKNPRIFELLLDSGAVIEKKNYNNITPLHMVFKRNNFDVISIIKKRNICITDTGYKKIALCNDNLEVFKYFFDKEPHIATKKLNELLMLAITGLAIETCRFLIKKGAEVNSIVDNRRPLHAAIFHGNIEIVELLIDNGANPNLKQGFITALELLLDGLTEPDIRIVELLVKAGCDVNSQQEKVTPLIKAIMLHRCDIVKVLLDNGADVNLHQPIIISIMQGDIIITEMLLQHPNINIVDVKIGNATLLHLAAPFANPSIIKILISKGCNVNAITEKNITPLFLATGAMHLNVVEVLVDNGADVKAKIIKVNSTALHIAAEIDACNILEFLIKRGAKLCTSESGKTPIHVAIHNESYDCIEFLAKHRKGLNVAGIYKMTPLHFATQNDFLHGAKCLLENGADPNLRDENLLKPIQTAAKHNSINTLKYLIEGGFNDLVDNELTKQSLLHFATQEHNYDAVDYLLSIGCDINATDVIGVTPLYVAAKYTTTKMCEFLLERGAHFEIGKLPLYLVMDFFNPEGRQFLVSIQKLFSAVRKNDESQVANLLRAKENPPYVSTQDTKGQTVLHYAVEQANENIVGLLINANAPVNHRDNKGNSPLHLAVKLGNMQLTKKLLNSGAIYNFTNNNHKKPIDLATNSNIVDLFKLIERLFNLIEQKDVKILNNVKNVRNFHEIKTQLANARNSVGDTIFAYAIKNNFTKLQELKDHFVGNDTTDRLREKACVNREDYDEAIRICEKVVKNYGEILGYNNPETLEIQKRIALYYFKKNNFQEAFDLTEKIYEKQRLVLGNEHPRVLLTRYFLGLILLDMGKKEESLTVLEEVLEMQKTVLNSETHEDITDTMTKLAVVLERMDRYDEALEIDNKLLKIFERQYGREHPITLDIWDHIGVIYSKQKKYESIDVFDLLLKYRHNQMGSNHSSILRTQKSKIEALIDLQRFDDAFNEYTKIYNKKKAAMGDDHPATLDTRVCMAALKVQHCRLTEAMQIIDEIYEKIKAIYGSNHPKFNVVDRLKVLCSTTMKYGLTNNTYEKICADIETNMGEKFEANKENDEPLKHCLFEAITNGDQSEVCKCLTTNTNAIKFEDTEGSSPLQRAVYLGKSQIVDLLLKHNSDVMKKTKKGNTILHLAVNQGHLNVCESIIKWMAASNSKQLSRLLNSKTFAGGKTALHVAAMKGNERITYLLLQSGAIYNEPDTMGKTAKDISTDPVITNLLKTIDEIFCSAREGDFTVLNNPHLLGTDMLSAVLNTKNNLGKGVVRLVLEADDDFRHLLNLIN